MRLFATCDFLRRAKKIGLEEEALRTAAARLEEGAVDAQLGSGLVKQRIERGSHGRASSARAIMFWKQGDFVLCLEVFLKSERATLGLRELRALRKLALVYSRLASADIERLLLEGRWSQLE